MRIAIPMSSHDPKWGGPGIYTREIVESLLRVDSRNEYVLAYPRWGRARHGVGQYASRYPNCTELMTSWSPPLSTVWEQTALPAALAKQKIDVLFNPFWSAPMFAKYKTVLIVHNTEFHTVPGIYDLRRTIEWTLHDRVWIHRADAVISISNIITEDLVRYVHLDRSKIRLIYHGCSERFRVINDAARLQAARAKYRLPEKFILFVGMIFPQKNFINLVRAFHRIRDEVHQDLVVIGIPRWKYAEDFALIDELGLRDRVHFVGFVPNEELPEVYNLADCFVYPSLYEAFGLAGVEALACGCPTAGANAAAIPEVLGDAALLFDPHDPAQMARQILTLLRDSNVRETCVRKGLERAKFFRWDRTARETLSLMQDVVTGTVTARGLQPRAID
jgi:glycosyltransferase involved in cell wall biosynthesis